MWFLTFAKKNEKFVEVIFNPREKWKNSSKWFLNLRKKTIQSDFSTYAKIVEINSLNLHNSNWNWSLLYFYVFIRKEKKVKKWGRLWERLIPKNLSFRLSGCFSRWQFFEYWKSFRCSASARAHPVFNIKSEMRVETESPRGSSSTQTDCLKLLKLL